MASRAQQKAAARAAREARQQALSTAQTRRQRLMMLSGLVAVAAVAIVVAVVAGGGGNKTTTTPASNPAARAAVIALLKGIPQSGNTLGNPNAPVTITEYGDLVCPICKDFALGSEQQIITSLVRTGNAKLVYRGFETASQTANNGEYAASQIAARAAGQQHRAWQYILLWYNEQGDETTPYVTDAYMQGLAQQVPGLKLTTWQADRNSATLANAVTADAQAASAAGVTGTPSVFFSGPKGAVPFSDPSSSFPSLAQAQALVTQVG
jgi:protein-disulfide isomerase